MKRILRACNSALLNNTYYYRSKKNISHATNDNYYKDTNTDNDRNGCNRNKFIIGIGIATLLAYEFNERKTRNVSLQADTRVGSFREDLPIYSMEEVTKHNKKEKRIWVTYRQGVYDITDFVDDHPGGEQIMMAAGGAIDSFWRLYGAHKTPEIKALLETMRIGNLSLNDARGLLKDMSDPYCEEPPRHTTLKVTSQKPFNAEPPGYILVDNYLTPNDLFYVRNHLPVPLVDIETYELEIEAEGVQKSKILTFSDIKKLPKHQITATIMCAGNRRSEMSKVKPLKGLEWAHASVGNAVWAGAKLTDVLKLMGIDEDTKGYNHVHFQGLDTDTTNTSYAASIPFAKASNKRGDVLLAYEMNGEPLPRDHGYPIRVIVPGVVGARNVKWLHKIILSAKECDSHWQYHDYKGFSPSVDWDTVDWDTAPAIQELPVISAICKPSQGDTVRVRNGHFLVQGYAWSGDGKKIIRIDVTADEGNTWLIAKLDFQGESLPPQHWSWTLWSVQIPVKPGTKEMEIWAKAVDSCYNTQPEDFKNIWNLRGVLNHAYHRVKVTLKW